MAGGNVTRRGLLHSAAGPRRFYAPADPFNTPIAPSHATDANNSAWSTMITSNTANSNLGSNAAFGLPVYQAVVSDPQYTIAGSVYFTGTSFTFNLPSGANANTGSDGHLIVISPDGVTETDFFVFTRPSGPACSSLWQNRVDSQGSSVCPLVGGVAGGNDASKLGGLAGLIRAAELSVGVIPHALSFVIPQTASTYRAPATGSDGVTSGGIPMGSRIQLDPAYTIPGGTSVWLTAILTALQVYGAILTDTGGSLSLLAESTTTGAYPTGAGGAPSLNGSVPWSSVRVLA